MLITEQSFTWDREKMVPARRCSNIQRCLVLTSCKVIGQLNIDYFEQAEDIMKYLF